MPVRKIPKNYRNLTGIAATKKSEAGFFESTLERDFSSLLEFEDRAWKTLKSWLQVKNAVCPRKRNAGWEDETITYHRSFKIRW